MVKIFEDIKDYIDGKYFDFITNREMNGKDPNYFGDVSDEIAQELYDFFNELIEDEVITEAWTSDSNLESHFKKHCIGNSEKKSNKRNIRYDFVSVDEYKEYENKIIKKVLKPKYEVLSLFNTVMVFSALEDITKNSTSILFDTPCGFKNHSGKIKIGLDSFADDVTTNYSSPTTNLIILSNANDTISLYPIDVSLIRNKFTSLVNKYNNNKKVRKLYNDIKNNEKGI